jgi:hypothetical protein
MARHEDYVAKPFPVTSVAPATNAAISLSRAAPAKNLQWALKQARLDIYGAAPGVAPTLTISGGGMAQAIVVVATMSGTTGTVTFAVPHTVLLMAESTAYTLDVPALGVGCIAALHVFDRVLAT